VLAVIQCIISNEATSGPNADLLISNTSEPNVTSLKRLSILDRLRVVQHQYRTDTNGANS